MLFQDRSKGILIALFGIICITPDAVLVRFLSSNDVEPWTIVFWKMIFSLPITATYTVYDMGGFQALQQTLKQRHGRPLLAAAIIPQAAVNIGFTFAFVHTTAAHALLLINLNPLWCAVAGRLFLGDTLPTRTIVALFLAMGCMLVTFVPEIVDNDDDAETTTKGNVISLLTGFAIATYITLVRKGGIEGINMMPVAPTAALVAGIVALAMQRGQVLGHHVPWQAGAWKFWLAMAAEGTMVGIVFVALAIAPRLITGAELALVLLVEVILGPLWVFCAYGETPSSWTLIGGLSLLVLLALHEAIPMIFSQGDEEDVDESSDKAIATKLGEQEDTEKIAATLGDIDQSDTTHPLQQEKSDV